MTIDGFLARYCDPRYFDEAGREKTRRHLSLRTAARGTALVREGQYHSTAYYLVQGAVRSYYLQDGIEVNTWFAFENEVVGSFQNYLERPARETIEVVEDARLIAIKFDTLKPLIPVDAQVGNFTRALIEEYTDFLEERLHQLQYRSSMERYLSLLENEPEVFRRIPLTYNASYLGIARETLSRLRGRNIL